MNIRADFACLAKCKGDDGEAIVYEITFDPARCPTRCPVCGSKRLRRLFNAINVIGAREVRPDTDLRLTSSSPAVVKDALLQPGFDHADQHKPRDKKLRSWAIPNVALADPGYASKAGQGRPMRELERAALARHDPQPQNISNVLAAIARQGIPSIQAGR